MTKAYGQYRGSDLVLWHQAEEFTVSPKIGYRGWSGHSSPPGSTAP
jgi:hypothetical protein